MSQLKVNSSNRALFLAIKNMPLLSILSDSQATRCEMSVQLDVSKKTIYRRCNDLKHVHLIKELGNTYQITSFGTFFHDILSRLPTLDNYDNHTPNIGSIINCFPSTKLINANWLMLDSCKRPINVISENIRSSNDMKYISSSMNEFLLRECIYRSEDEELSLEICLTDTNKNSINESEKEMEVLSRNCKSFKIGALQSNVVASLMIFKDLCKSYVYVEDQFGRICEALEFENEDNLELLEYIQR